MINFNWTNLAAMAISAIYERKSISASNQTHLLNHFKRKDLIIDSIYFIDLWGEFKSLTWNLILINTHRYDSNDCLFFLSCNSSRHGHCFPNRLSSLLNVTQCLQIIRRYSTLKLIGSVCVNPIKNVAIKIQIPLFLFCHLASS